MLHCLHYQYQNLRQYCHVDVTAEEGCVCAIRCSSCDPCTTALSPLWNYVLHVMSLRCRSGNNAWHFNVDSLKSVAPQGLVLGQNIPKFGTENTSAATFRSSHFPTFCHITEFSCGLDLTGHRHCLPINL